MIDDILLFIKVASAGSVSAVEKKFAIPKSTISRHIANLEAQMGGALITRTRQGIALTELGYNVYDKFKDYENRLSDRLNCVTNKLHSIKNQLNILLPLGLAEHYILPTIGDFLIKYPDLHLNLMHSFEDFNMRKELYDIAIVYYTPKQQTQKVKFLCYDKIVLFCTPKYAKLHGLFDNLENINNHLIVGKTHPSGQQSDKVTIFKETTNAPVEVRIKNKIYLNNFIEAKTFVKHHNGIAGLPIHYAKEEVERGEFIRVLPGYHCGRMNYYLMRNLSENDINYKIFMEFLMSCLEPLMLKSDYDVSAKQLFHI